VETYEWTHAREQLCDDLNATLSNHFIVSQSTAYCVVSQAQESNVRVLSVEPLKR
jgi:hypothetical protein